MNHYTYTDYRRGEFIGWVYTVGYKDGPSGRPFRQFAGDVIFECDAENISEADTQINALGIVRNDDGDAAKISQVVAIGCSVRALAQPDMQEG